MRVIMMFMAFAATMLTGCPAPSAASEPRGAVASLAEFDQRPRATLPSCRIAYKLRPGERATEMCSISRLHARQGIVQVQTNSELLDASLVAVTPTDCLDGPCTWDVIVTFTNRSTVSTAGEVGVRGW